MTGKGLLLISVGLLILVGAIFYFPKNNPPSPDNTIILFYGEGCPHCAKVDEYITQNKIEEKITFERKEVYNNQENARLLAQKAASCKISTGTIGVPFLWDGPSSRCIIGDVDIIKFFEEKTKNG